MVVEKIVHYQQTFRKNNVFQLSHVTFDVVICYNFAGFLSLKIRVTCCSMQKILKKKFVYC